MAFLFLARQNVRKIEGVTQSSSRHQSESQQQLPQRVAAIICAYNAERDIAETVRSCRAIPAVDMLIVIDDGSEDATGHNARRAGAVVVRHSIHRGRASAHETGVKVAAMRDRPDSEPRALLFLSADLGESAVEAAGLVEPVLEHQVDFTVAMPPGGMPKGGGSLAERVARRVIRHRTGWNPVAPLAEQRCIRRQALAAAMPFANGYGLEPAQTIDSLTAGFTVMEVACSFAHLGADRSIGARNPRQQVIDVGMAMTERSVKRGRLPLSKRAAALKGQRVGAPFPPVSA